MNVIVITEETTSPKNAHPMNVIGVATNTGEALKLITEHYHKFEIISEKQFNQSEIFEVSKIVMQLQLDSGNSTNWQVHVTMEWHVVNDILN